MPSATSEIATLTITVGNDDIDNVIVDDLASARSRAAWS